MAERKNPPFEVFTFTLVENKAGRSFLRLALREDGAFDLHAEKGSASRPLSQVDHVLSADRIQTFKDRLDALGVFGWDESYPDDVAPGSVKWTYACIFKRDVFSVSARGGSSTPQGFESVLEELYQLGLPRPKKERAPRQSPADALSGVFPKEALDVPPEVMQDALAEIMKNPEAARERMRDEFKSMSPAQREQIIDALTATGSAPRSFWEQFFNGL